MSVSFLKYESLVLCHKWHILFLTFMARSEKTLSWSLVKSCFVGCFLNYILHILFSFLISLFNLGYGEGGKELKFKVRLGLDLIRGSGGVLMPSGFRAKPNGGLEGGAPGSTLILKILQGKLVFLIDFFLHFTFHNFRGVCIRCTHPINPPLLCS